MGVGYFRRLLAILTLLAAPAITYAQDATLTGTVTDSTGGVLPGVAVTAIHEASGNTFEGVTDEHGVFEIHLRTGAYRITAQLQGFAVVTRSGVELLVGQQAIVNLQLAPSTLQESVTVTADAPLVETTRSSQASNIDPRQLSELPVNGRNWLDLTMLAAGSRINTVSSDDLMPKASVGTSQLNVDGHQVTSTISATGFGQPHYARDSIAEFEFVANRFDASQGRSSGVQVNAVTKSGTNTFTGTTAGYFRSDRFNARDFIVNRVLPYSNQQFSTTFGGPIRKDRIHFFGNYEYEREPSTQTYTTAYPSFNRDLTGTRTDPKAGGRVDFQFSSQVRLMVRGNVSRLFTPYDSRYTGGSSQTPSSSESTARPSNELYGALTQVLGTKAVNEIKVGYDDFFFRALPTAVFANHPANASFPSWAKGRGAPRMTFSGFAIGQAHTNAPQRNGQVQYSIRDDYRTSYNLRGRHSAHFGAEWLHQWGPYFQCTNCMGTYDGGSNRPPANFESLFPDILDVSTWNLAPLSPLFRTYSVGISAAGFKQRTPKEIAAAWIQDDWTVTSRMTVNLGLRYDISKGQFAERVAILPWVEAGRSLEKNRFGPRVGFAYTLDERTVIRGGTGKYFADVSDQVSSWTERYGGGEINAQVAYDGRADFAGNPWNSRPQPTYEEALRIPGLRKSVSQIATPNLRVPYAYESSIGLQRQFGATMALQADYVVNNSRHELFQRNINLTYNPATGVNYVSTDATRAVYADWGVVNAYLSEGWSNFHALEMAFTRRMSHRWQASGTYTLSVYRDGTTSPAPAIKLVQDLGEEYGLATTDQRHRAVFNGIWDVGYGFQLSGLYFYGSGQRFATTYGGGDRTRLRPDGSIVPRNNFVGLPLHRVDFRLLRRFGLGGRGSIDGIAEAYNLFNHANYGSYTLAESNANYGRPIQNVGLAYQPRMVQLGFRIGF
jgi:Carboxypeptidase regulatory-like domain